MEAIVPYLNFKGNAKEALDFYATALNGTIIFAQTYGESPTPTEAEHKDKIMHATFKAGDLTIMASDVVETKFELVPGTNVSLSLNFENEADIERVFAAMSEGANITMPLQKTFWGAKFGMLTDKFDVNWMFNHDYEAK